MGRSPCCDKDGIKKGPWTPEEDLKLVHHIQLHGPGNWRNLPKNAGLQRCGKSCRLRWTNYLRPDIKRGRFSFEEEEAIIQLHSILGNKWSAIAARLPGRTDNEVKNYWNTHIRKRLLKMGIDPVTHSPRLDLLDLSSILSSAHQLNLSNLLGLQSLVNPEELLLRLATTLLASQQPYHEKYPEMLLQKLQDQNQLFNIQMQNDQTPIQGLATATSSLLNQPQLIMPGMEVAGQFSTTNSVGLSCQNFQENGSFVGQPNYGFNMFDQIATGGPSEKSSFPISINNVSSQNFTFDSVLSTPMSSPTPLNSLSTFINSSSTEDERDSYGSNMLKFEIPESLDFDDFM